MTSRHRTLPTLPHDTFDDFSGNWTMPEDWWQTADMSWLNDMDYNT